MRANLNLATRSFGWARLFWMTSATTAAVLAITALALVGIWFQNREPPPEASAAELRLGGELSEIEAAERELAAWLRQPETIEIYDRSYFLNQILLRKGISWTKTFVDLESILPPRVLMMQIRPEIGFDNRIDLEMLVGAETPADFIEFLKAIEGAEMFGAPDVRGYSPPNENQPFFRYELAVRYEQQL